MSMSSFSSPSPFISTKSNLETLPTLHQQVTQNSTTLYDQYVDVLSQILAMDTVIPQSIQHFLNCSTNQTESKPNSNKNQSSNTQQSTSVDSPDHHNSTHNSTKDIQLDSLQLSLNSEKNSFNSSIEEHRFQTHKVQSDKKQRQQTKFVVSKIEKESKELDNSNFVTLSELQADVANLLIYSDEQLTPYLCQYPVSFHSLLNLLHRALVLTSKTKKQTEFMLNPILTTLLECCKRSPQLAKHCKVTIFEEYSFKKKSSSESDNDETQRMVPEGAVDERIIDYDPQSIKSLLLPLLTSLHYSIKQLAGELIFVCCSKDSFEYIRLCGFGNAVGLLVDKDLPGFMGLKEKAHDVDDLLKAGKKL